ncbi:MAG: C25 family cysteine peptidase, partial [Thermoanaerobaculia bacterium]
RDANGTLTRLNSVAVSAAGGGYTAVVPGAAGEAAYVVASESALLPARSIRAARPAVGLRTGPATYLVIAHSAFIGGLQPLVAARTAEGLAVKVVDVQDIYASYRGGVVDASAIRDYIAEASRSMGTRYVLLVGGDSFDYLDNLGLGAVSFVPSLYVETGPIIRWAPSDSTYADVDRDGIQDLAIGRWPVRSAQELSNVIAKTLEYATKGYGNTALFTSDYADPKANEAYRFASGRLIDALPQGWQVDRIDLDQMAFSDARAALFGGLTDGSALTSYVGHSGPVSWGSGMRPMSQHLLTVNDVATLGNAGHPTVVSQLGCWNNYYVSPSTESLGAKLLLAGDRGAAAVIGAVSLTEDTNGNRFGLALTSRLGLSGMRIGDAISAAKRTFAVESQPESDLRDVLLGWTLLGDPALQVAP